MGLGHDKVANCVSSEYERAHSSFLSVCQWSIVSSNQVDYFLTMYCCKQIQIASHIRRTAALLEKRLIIKKQYLPLMMLGFLPP